MKIEKEEVDFQIRKKGRSRERERLSWKSEGRPIINDPLLPVSAVCILLDQTYSQDRSMCMRLRVAHVSERTRWIAPITPRFSISEEIPIVNYGRESRPTCELQQRAVRLMVRGLNVTMLRKTSGERTFPSAILVDPIGSEESEQLEFSHDSTTGDR